MSPHRPIGAPVSPHHGLRHMLQATSPERIRSNVDSFMALTFCKKAWTCWGSTLLGGRAAFSLSGFSPAVWASSFTCWPVKLDSNVPGSRSGGDGDEEDALLLLLLPLPVVGSRPVVSRNRWICSGVMVFII